MASSSLSSLISDYGESLLVLGGGRGKVPARVPGNWATLPTTTQSSSLGLSSLQSMVVVGGVGVSSSWYVCPQMMLDRDDNILTATSRTYSNFFSITSPSVLLILPDV